MYESPPGWTDEMSICLPPNHCIEEVVEFVIRAGIEGKNSDATERELVAAFGISPDDAELARDRVFGGIVRAATGIAENCPVQSKDPLAWSSYQRALRDPSIIAAIYPEYARPKGQTQQSSPRVSRRPWWRFWE